MAAMSMNTSILADYRSLLGEVDDWFNTCLEVGGSKLACRVGCSHCCRALFDITLLDAWLLKDAFTRLPQSVQQKVLTKCRSRLAQLQHRWPQLQQPYLLNTLPEEEWTAMPEEDATRCPLLDQQGRCLVYASRPLVCRLHGLPNVDAAGEDFEGTVCTLHPGDALDLPEDVLRWRFREVFEQELALFRDFAEQLGGRRLSELDTFIPLALLADYQSTDWVKVFNDC